MYFLTLPNNCKDLICRFDFMILELMTKVSNRSYVFLSNTMINCMDKNACIHVIELIFSLNDPIRGK